MTKILLVEETTRGSRASCSVASLDAEAREATGGDRGWVWVTRLELAF